MRERRSRGRALAALAALVVASAGCVAPAPAAGGADAPVGAADACAALRPAVERTLGVEVALDPGGEGPGGTCRLRAQGTADVLGSFVEVASDLAAILEARGWRADPALAADGPTGTRAGHRRGAARATIAVRWAPIPPATCPSDRPVVACEVPPEQGRITATLVVTIEPWTSDADRRRDRTVTDVP